MTLDLPDKDCRMVSYALWLVGHELLSRAAAGAQKTSNISLDGVRDLMRDGNRLLEIAAALRQEPSQS